MLCKLHYNLFSQREFGPPVLSMAGNKQGTRNLLIISLVWQLRSNLSSDVLFLVPWVPETFHARFLVSVNRSSAEDLSVGQRATLKHPAAREKNPPVLRLSFLRSQSRIVCLLASYNLCYKCRNACYLVLLPQFSDSPPPPRSL